MMYGQMTAGSWIYIGTQGILQGTYETLRRGGARSTSAATCAGRCVLTGGLGGMGGAQPLAATMNGGVCLGVEVDPARIERRLETALPATSVADDLDEALALRRGAREREAARSRSALRRQRRRRAARAGAPRRRARPRHRSDLGARSAQRLRPARA